MKLTKEQKSMIEENHGLIYGFIDKYRLRPLLDDNKHHKQIDDIYGVLAESLCTAVVGFDKSYGTTLSTYAYKVMYNDYLNLISHNTCKKRDVRNELEMLNEQIDFENLFATRFDETSESIELKCLLDYIENNVSKRQFQAFTYKCNGDNVNTIAAKIGITHQAASMHLKKVKNVINNYYDYINGGNAYEC